jgi:hypothetical protein
MCFRTSKSGEKPVKTKEDIVAFKILLLSPKFGYRSPFQKKARWKVGEVKDDPDFQKVSDYYKDVEQGIHSFRTFDDAYNYYHRTSAHKIVLATIPAGSLVYKNDTQYCSNALRIDAIMPLKKKRGK